MTQAFFLTAKVLHLGPVHVLQQRTRYARHIQHLEQDVAALDRHLQRWAPFPAHVVRQQSAERGDCHRCLLRRMLWHPSGGARGGGAGRRRLAEPQLSMARRQHQHAAATLDRLQGDLMLMDTQLQVRTRLSSL